MAATPTAAADAPPVLAAEAAICWATTYPSGSPLTSGKGRPAWRPATHLEYTPKAVALDAAVLLALPKAEMALPLAAPVAPGPLPLLCLRMALVGMVVWDTGHC